MSQPFLYRYDYIHEILNYGTAFWWFLAYLLLLHKLRKERSALGLSLQTLISLVIVEIGNVFLILTLSAYLRKRSLSLDFYLVDCSTAFISTFAFFYVVRNFYPSYEVQKDTFGKKFFSLCCTRKISDNFYFLFLYFLALLVAFPTFVIRRQINTPSTSGTLSLLFSSSLHSSLISFWECYNDSVLALALLPQLFMFYNKRPRTVSALLGNFVICLLIARILALAYWLSFPLFHVEAATGRGVHMFTELLNLFILSDFLYYYLKAKLKGLQYVTLPI